MLLSGVHTAFFYYFFSVTAQGFFGNPLLRKVSLETLIENPLTSMTLVFASATCPRPEVRVTAEAP